MDEDVYELQKDIYKTAEEMKAISSAVQVTANYFINLEGESGIDWRTTLNSWLEVAEDKYNQDVLPLIDKAEEKRQNLDRSQLLYVGDVEEELSDIEVQSYLPDSDVGEALEAHEEARENSPNYGGELDIGPLYDAKNEYEELKAKARQEHELKFFPPAHDPTPFISGLSYETEDAEIL